MDPILTYKFQVSWSIDGQMQVVAGVSKLGPLARTTEVASYGNEPSPYYPGQTKYDEIKLERGIILDIGFEQWANKAWFYENSNALGEQVSLLDFRRDLQIDLMNQAGQTVNRYFVFNAWPSSYTSMPELDASAGATVAVESLTLQNEGWQRDDSYSPPAYPTYVHPDAPVGGQPPE